MDYFTRFNNQTHNFLDAVQSYENALDEEMMTAIKMLDLKQNEILLNAFAGGIPIDKYIDKSLNIRYLEYDTNKEFSNTNTDIIYYTIDNIPIESQSIDKILCLATLHHFNNQERQKLYKEFYRVLKPYGMLVIADVIENSSQAKWLNVFVNQYNSNGHKGNFFLPTDSQLIKNTGFNVTISIQHYNWKFSDDYSLIHFYKLLFGLDLCKDDNFILDNIKHYLEYQKLTNIIIPWKLLYFNCTI